jgi:hypothetical protein
MKQAAENTTPPPARFVRSSGDTGMAARGAQSERAKRTETGVFAAEAERLARYFFARERR